MLLDDHFVIETRPQCRAKEDFKNIAFLSYSRHQILLFNTNLLHPGVDFLYPLKRPWHRCFPMNFSKFLRTPFLKLGNEFESTKCDLPTR